MSSAASSRGMRVFNYGGLGNSDSVTPLAEDSRATVAHLHTPAVRRKAAAARLAKQRQRSMRQDAAV
jgi:hypothetical protein